MSTKAVVEIICRQCGKKVQAKTHNRMYCSDCQKELAKARSKAWYKKRKETYQKPEFLESKLPEPSWKNSLDLFMHQVDLYNVFRRMSGQPELSYGQYVALFDKENAAPSGATPESGKN